MLTLSTGQLSRARARLLACLSAAVVAAVALLGALTPSASAAVGPNNAITDVPGIEVGHSTRRAATTGTTALIFRNGALMGYAPSGGAPGDRLSYLLTGPHQDSQRVVSTG